MRRFTKLSIGRSLLSCVLFSLLAESCYRRHPVAQKSNVHLIRADQEKLNLALAETIFQEGLRFEYDGQYEKAIAAFTQAIAVVNNHYPSWLHRGRVDLLREKPSGALMYLEAAVSLRPDDPQALHWRADAYLPLGEPRKAIADYDRALQFETDTLERAAMYASRGEAYLQLNEDSKALEDYSNAITARPGWPKPYFMRGLLLEKLGKVQDSERDFTLATALGPNYEEARVALDRVQGQLARQTNVTPPPAEQQLAIAPSPTEPPPAAIPQSTPGPIEPNPPQLPSPRPAAVDSVITARAAQERWRSAVQAIYAKQEKKAIEELDEAIRLKPDYAQAFNARGFARLLLRDYGQAIADFDAALQISPNYPNALHNRNAAVTASRQASRAIPTAAPVAPPIPSDSAAAVRWRAARELIQAGRYDSAVRQLDGAIDLKPTYAQAFNARGYVWLLLRDYQRAIADFDQALRLLPNYSNAAHNREVALKASTRAGRAR